MRKRKDRNPKPDETLPFFWLNTGFTLSLSEVMDVKTDVNDRHRAPLLSQHFKGPPDKLSREAVCVSVMLQITRAQCWTL